MTFTLHLAEFRDAPSTEQMDRFYEYYRIPEPSGHRALLEQANGARLEGVELPSSRGPRLVLNVIGLPSDRNAAERDVAAMVSILDERLATDPSNDSVRYLPILMLFGGDMVCIDLDSADRALVIWYHEESAPFSPSVERIPLNLSELIVDASH